MRAILFGSIGSVIEASELQREAFNRAFRRCGLDWEWDRDTYRDMLKTSGGQSRIEDYAAERGQNVDSEAVHHTKTAIFQDMLSEGALPLRPGVADLLEAARMAGFRIGLVSGTEPGTVDKIEKALSVGSISPFDIVTHRHLGLPGKPDPALYIHALDAIGLGALDAVAIEDNPDGVTAAKAAGIETFGFPGENNRAEDLAHADEVVAENVFEALRARISSPAFAAI